MKIKELLAADQEPELLDEASYPGNLGMVEMFKFYQVASEEQKREMKHLMKLEKFAEAWEMLQRVTKVKLHPLK